MTEEGVSDDAVEGGESGAAGDDEDDGAESVGDVAALKGVEDVASLEAVLDEGYEITADGIREGADGDDDESDGSGNDADGSADADEELDIPLPWNTVSDDGEAGDERAGDSDGGGDSGGGDDESAEAADEERSDPERFEDLRFVGPKSAAVLRDSSVSLSDVVRKRVAYRDLTEAGVNPGVAAKIRREHSLSWSLDGGGTDLDRRSAQVRGLDDDERAWIAASSGWSEEETATETDGSGAAADAEAAWRADAEGDAAAATGGTNRSDDASLKDEARWRDGATGTDGAGGSTDSTSTDAEAAWRRRSAPTPLTAVGGIDEEVAAALRRAGIGSVRRLSTADPESVADALDLDVDRVESWRRLAREHESS